ncbi:hypothetical protein CYJ70_06910 [Gardnerella pickettii]|uniref:Uncharacterized protein n=1 Tax=Gardnerella pickettii TaxID=2914924 RepID=A0ABX4SJ39_9BIFI|nr:hypothetical protein CYJ70_06910 [Gardnerella pickettii]
MRLRYDLPFLLKRSARAIFLTWYCARFEYFSPRRRANLPSSLERSAKRQFGALSLLKVESTVCFQRKRRRSRA